VALGPRHEVRLEELFLKRAVVRTMIDLSTGGDD